MKSGIEIPIRWERANRSPASPRHSHAALPAGVQQQTEDHCGPKIVDPAQPATPASASPTLPFVKPARTLEPGQLAGWTPGDTAVGGVRGRRLQKSARGILLAALP